MSFNIPLITFYDIGFLDDVHNNLICLCCNYIGIWMVCRYFDSVTGGGNCG